MIRTAAASDKAAISALLHEAFGDALEYISLFLDKRMNPDHTLLYFIDNTLAAQLFILECELVFNGTAHKCGYIYAVSTAKAFRRQGISTRLLEYCHDFLLNKGFSAAVLVPSSAELASFYAKRGYHAQGVISLAEFEFSAQPQNRNAVKLSPLTANELYRLREMWFGSGYLRWDIPSLEYILDETRFLKGNFYRFSWGNKDCFASCVPLQDSLLIKELACPENAVPHLLTALGSIYQKNKFSLRLSPELFSAGKTVPAGMCRLLKDDAANGQFYLSHFLD
ncbi:MAG: GNAT family N-acetyltransferase [Oscillospiraceae bacterium]|nr:GNAT family N-acetyltransferase [Oscillospiraceae bacterium]